MDATRHSGAKRLRFSLRTLLAAVVLVLVACGFAVQQLRIQRLLKEQSNAESNRRIMLFYIPGASAGPRMAGYIGGEFVELRETIRITDRRNRMRVDAGEKSLVATVNGRTIRCTTLTIDPASGQLESDSPHFFEQLGIDFDFAAQ